MTVQADLEGGRHGVEQKGLFFVLNFEKLFLLNVFRFSSSGELAGRFLQMCQAPPHLFDKKSELRERDSGSTSTQQRSANARRYLTLQQSSVVL